MVPQRRRVTRPHRITGGDDGAVRDDARLRIRRVGFRAGSDEELRSLHEVEAPIEAERGSTRMPRSLDAYVAFARNLPSQFDDHAWLVETGGGAPIAAAYCWSNSAGDARVMECDVLVRDDRRREGLGSQLMTLICDEALAEGRPRLTWSTFEAVPAAEPFSRRLGGAPVRVNRTSDLSLAAVDWELVGRWAAGAPGRAAGYSLEFVDGTFPEHLRADAVAFHHIMQTAPRDDLDVGDVLIDERFVLELDAALAKSGRRRWTLLVRDRDGRCVGGTEVMFEPDDAETVFQQNTGIHPEHRGIGLAKWVKATMLERVRVENPSARRLRTGNAFSNGPMLAINDALGYAVVSTTTEWQAEVAQVRSLLR